MQVEPVHQLALALSSSPKLFACVLGSGVSRAANIRTGWEITLDLVAKHAAQLGQSEAAAKDPAAWHAAKYGGEPDYSEVVSKLAPTTDLRRNLLEPYFTVLDPVTGERREHPPTAAHHAIAQLVKRGLVRVIVTTNFDRLMENALREAGVASIEVVSSDEEAANCYPFHACECFVFKVHGDWKDTRLRNSNAELAEYPPGIAKLLRRIASEHGLIVCGWSAEYDVALRGTIARYQRRFPLFWADPKLGDRARALLTQLRGTHVAATGDEFFSELELAVAALDRQRPPPPLSGDVLVARARRMIEQKQEMALDDLVDDATRALCAWIEARNDTAPNNSEEDWQQAQAVEQRTEPLARLIGRLAWHGTEIRRAQHSLSRLLGAAANRFVFDWRDPIAAYPAVIAAYAWGIACAARGDWRSAIVGVREANSGLVAIPPCSNSRFHRFGDFKYSPEAVWGDRLSAYLYGISEHFVANRVEFERLYDRFDVLVAVLAKGYGREWIPRCFGKTNVSGEVPGAAWVFEEWFCANVLRANNDPEPHGLDEVFLGQTKAPLDTIEELRELAAAQRKRWSRP